MGLVAVASVMVCLVSEEVLHSVHSVYESNLQVAGFRNV